MPSAAPGRPEVRANTRSWVALCRPLLKRFSPVISQSVPSRRAVVSMTPRRVRIERLDLLGLPDADHAILEMDCTKGTYVRSLARDLAQSLGTLGHVSQLRRTAVGAFLEDDAISLDKLEDLGHSAALLEHVRPVETALDDIPALAVTDQQAAQLKFGQAVHVRCNEPGMVRATAEGRLVALVEVVDGMARPVRVFNL